MPRVIKCPSCAAPLEYDGTPLEKCAFCGSQIIVSDSDFQPEIHDETSFNFNNLFSQAQKLGQVLKLTRTGKKIEAIKLYREIFSVGLAEAKDAVEKLERGESVNFQNLNFQKMNFFGNVEFQEKDFFTGIKSERDFFTSTDKSALEVFNSVDKPVRQSRRGFLLLIIIPLLLVAFIFLISHFDKTADSTVKTSKISSPSADAKSTPANQVLQFGGEGTGAGFFEDNRSIAVDGEGRIYSGDYSGGRVQQFDANGKFLAQWLLDDEAALLKIQADKKNHVYLLTTRNLYIYDGTSGQNINKIQNSSYRDIAVSSDGKLYALTENNEFAKLSEQGKVLTKSADLTKQINFKIGTLDKLAVDAAGNFYVVEDKNNYILKFSSDAKFQYRFDAATQKNISNIGIEDLTVDGKGRIFTAEITQINIFSAEGRFIGSLPAEQTFGIAFDPQNNLWTASRPFVAKYQVKN